MRDGRTRHGFLFVTVMLVTAGLAILTAVGLTRSSTELLLTARFVAMQQAQSLAEGGLDCAIAGLRQTTDIGTTCNTGTRTVTATAVGNIYTIASTNTAVAPPRTITAKVQRSSTSPFQQAAFGTDSNDPQVVQLFPTGFGGGELVDSYDSRLGVYGEALGSADLKYGLLNQSQDALPSSRNGDIRTNSTRNGNHLDNAIILHGATPPPIMGVASKVMGKAVLPTGGGVYGAGQITNGIVNAPAQPLPQITSPSLPSDPSTCVLLPLTITTTVSYPADSCFYATDVTIGAGGKLSLPELNTLNVTGTLLVQNGGSLELGQGSANSATIRVVSMNVTSGGVVRVTEGVGPVNIYAERMQITDPGTVVKGYDADPSPTREWIRPDTLRVYMKRETLPLVFGMDPGAIIGYGATYYGTISSGNGVVRMDYNKYPLTSAGLFYVGAPVHFYGAMIGRYCVIGGGGPGAGVKSAVHYDEALKTAQNWPSWMPATVTVLAQY